MQAPTASAQENAKSIQWVCQNSIRAQMEKKSLQNLRKS